MPCLPLPSEIGGNYDYITSWLGDPQNAILVEMHYD